MSLGSLVAALLLFQCAHAFRLMKKVNGSSKSKYIAGVPVYNYELFEGQVQSASMLRDWLLLLSPKVTPEQFEAFCQDSMVECTPQGQARDDGIPFVQVQGTEQDVEKLIVANDGMVDFVEPDSPTHIIPELPVDANDVSIAAASWGLDTIGVSKATTKGRGVHVYVLDTGVRTTHSDFGGRAISTLEYVSSRPKVCYGSTSCARDVHGHGTHCAGTVGGSQYGVAPESTIHAVKVLSDSGTGSLSWIIGSIDWVVREGQRPAVVSMSLGGPGRSAAYTRAIDTASGNGLTVVVAAGNENSNACNFSPAFVPSAITVGSIDSWNRRSSFSNYGNCLQIYAPGSGIKSASHGSDTGSATMSGTSMACPHVAGAAALLLESSRGMRSTQVLSSLLYNARSGSISGLTSYDPNKLLYVGGGAGPVPTPAPTPGPSVCGGGCSRRRLSGNCESRRRSNNDQCVRM